MYDLEGANYIFSTWN